MNGLLHAFTTGKPFGEQKILEVSVGRDSGTPKGLLTQNRRNAILVLRSECVAYLRRPWI